LNMNFIFRCASAGCIRLGLAGNLLAQTLADIGTTTSNSRSK
jgi:hypothetical protein